jgi:hypothetical protein
MAPAPRAPGRFVTTDTTELGLELLIVCAITGRTDILVPLHQTTDTAVPVARGTGWLLGDAKHYEPAAAGEIAREIAEDLRAALEQFESVAGELAG